ncbi:MAG: hypothetical protein M1837_004553 [Sclerophora amabilis]|nr:MAG: hypothetical protein M1837_004553 [Sclerophora amabilis]
MSYYENQQWQNAPRHQSWEQPPPPSRSGSTSTVQQDDVTAFTSQYEDVDRALDNLVKSGKMFGMSGRRDSMPVMGGGPRSFSDYDQRMGGPPQRHHSVSEYDPTRSHSGSSLQNFYANQRHQPRPNDAEQMMQAKRRMAAQRERELRNYHQEQQYNRNISTPGKPDRAISPSAMNEDDRRDLIARQHRALYGNEGVAYPENGGFGEEGQVARPTAQGAGGVSATSGAAREHSPLTFDPFGLNQGARRSGSTENLGQLSKSEHQVKQAAGSGPSPVEPQRRSRANSTSSPSSNPTSSFSLFDNAAQQSSRTSTSSPGGSPPRQGGKAAATGVGPIGSRPTQSAQASNPAHNKRSTTPLPSPLSYGFAPNEGPKSNNERSTSAASNPPASNQEQHGVNLGWGSKSGVWGTKNALGVQASVWG